MELLRRGAHSILSKCLAVKKGERVLIIVDHPGNEVGRALWEEAQSLQTEPVMAVMTRRANDGEEPPPAVQAAMLQAEVIVAPTSLSLSHTRARREACAAGARVASMPGVTARSIARTLTGDYEEMEQRCRKTADLLTQASTARLTTARETDLWFSLTGREGVADTGSLGRPGSFGNLPAGEAFIAPVEDSAEGVLVVDVSLASFGKVDRPLKLVIEKGKAAAVEGGEAASWLREVLEKYGPLAAKVAELGIGLNEKAVITGSTLEDEKVLGTVHVALGDNSNFGGAVRVSSHLDGVISSPTLFLDGQVVVQDGVLLS